MKSFLLLLLPSLHLASTISRSDGCDNWLVDTVWDTGFNAHLLFAADHEAHGWELHLQFDSELDAFVCFTGDASSQDNINWVVKNMEWNGDINNGDTVDLGFQGTFSSATAPDLIYADLDGKDHSICGSAVPTPSPTPERTTKTTNKPDTTAKPDTTKPHPTQDPTSSPPFPTDHPGKYPYGEVLAKSILFYEAERSGSGEGNRCPYRGDSAMNDKIVGGYFDAGDHVKFGFPMAAMTTVLAWGGISFYEGYQKADQLEWFDKNLKWSLDYFMAAHTSDNELVGQIGDGGQDHGYWGRPEDMTMNRPAWSITASQPGSDLAGETAAALAAGSIYFKRRGDTSYSAELLSHARTLFDFADNHRGIYTDAIPAGGFYNSWSGYKDELLWSAAWLAKATDEDQYVKKAEAFYNQWDNLQNCPSEFSWDDKTGGAQILMYDVTRSSKYKANVQEFLNYIFHSDRTNKGLVWIDSSQWGSLRYAANFANIAMQAANLGVDVDNAVEFAESQINYILGDTGRSYVCGWGVNPPQKPHHRSSSCPDRPQQCGWNEGMENPGPNHQILYGALVGGPDHNDNYVDDRHNFQTNEVATDYNAGFQSVLAAMNQIYG